jgi:hypothetical protein
VFHSREIGRLPGTKLLCDEEVFDLLGTLEVEPMPIDDGVPAKDEAYGLEIGERELVERLEAVDRVGFGQVRSTVWRAGVPTSGVGRGACRPSNRVPTKIPMVRARTASWPKRAPEQPATAMGAMAAKYQGVSFIRGSPRVA